MSINKICSCWNWKIKRSFAMSTSGRSSELIRNFEVGWIWLLEFEFDLKMNRKLPYISYQDKTHEDPVCHLG